MLIAEVIKGVEVHTTGVNWSAVSAIAGPAVTAIIAVGGWLGKKLNRVGDHLKEQDRSKRYLSVRMARIEGKLGLAPMPIENGHGEQ